MKTILISSAISLVIGFTFGWLIKSATRELDSIVTVADPNATVSHSPEQTPETTPPNRERPERASLNGSAPKSLPAGTATIPASAKRSDRAKWMRLIEVLGLNDEQLKALESAMAEALAKAETGKSPEVTYTEAGAKLEKNILTLLDHEQRAAFAALQRRAMENRIEVSAQETYARELGELDLSPEQRAQALGLLRSRAEEIASDIPASARLLLAGSFLPIGDREFSEDAIRLLRQLSPQDTGDITLDKLAEKRRAESGENAALFERVLTPAQLELYRTRLSSPPDMLDPIRSGDCTPVSH